VNGAIPLRPQRHNDLEDDYCAGDKIDKNEMGGACSAYGEGRDVCTGFWWENLRERDHWEDPGVDGRIILTLILLTWKIW
jgi:hypothetical protein